MRTPAEIQRVVADRTLGLIQKDIFFKITVSEPDKDSRGDSRGVVRDLSLDDGTIVRLTFETIVY